MTFNQIPGRLVSNYKFRLNRNFFHEMEKKKERKRKEEEIDIKEEDEEKDEEGKEG